MTTATFSSTRTAGHVVDRGFLLAVEAMLMRILEEHGARILDVSTELSFRSGAHGRLKTKGTNVAEAIADADSLADGFRLSIYGREGQLGHGETFMVSIDLDPVSGDHIYANGPAAIAYEVHESLTAAFEAGETLHLRWAEERNRIAAERDPALWNRVSTNDRFRRMLDRIPFGACLIGYPILLAAVVLSSKPVAAIAAGAILALIAFGLWSSHQIPELRRSRQTELEERAEKAGMIVPGTNDRPFRRIDLRHDRPSDSAKLSYDPMIPLVIPCPT